MAVEFKGSRSPITVLHDNQKVGTLSWWIRGKPHWRFIDSSRAHFDAGLTLAEATAWVERHLRAIPRPRRPGRPRNNDPVS